MKRSVKSTPVVGIIMGSDSDWPVMQNVHTALQQFKIACEVRVLSAHRLPTEMKDYAEQAEGRGLQVIVAGAGGAAHLPGMLAASTILPVIGVPVSLKPLEGIDSLLSIVQMPKGVPVATVAIDNGWNAGLLAVQILALKDEALKASVHSYRNNLAQQVKAKEKLLLKKLR